MAEELTDEQTEALKAAAEAEGDTIDPATLPDGLRPEPPPETEEVTINGVKVALTKEQADAYRAEQQAYHDELEEARQAHQPEPAEPVVPEPTDEDNWDDLWFTDPAKAVERIEERVTRKLTGQYQQERQKEQFWTDFDRENPNLSDKRWVAEAVLRDEMDVLGPMSGAAARKKLAELTKERIMALAPQQKTEPNETATLEGASAPTLRVINTEESDQPQSLSAAIRAKAAQRAQKKG